MRIHFCDCVSGNCAWDNQPRCAKQNQEGKLTAGFGFFPHFLRDADRLFICVQREWVVFSSPYWEWRFSPAVAVPSSYAGLFCSLRCQLESPGL